MTGFLSLPSELLSTIIETCPEPERCCLRATCKLLNEHADPIVFRRLRLYHNNELPDIAEHQILALTSQSSKACELTKDLEINRIQDNCRNHLPAAILMLGNLTCFRWVISDGDHEWQIDSLMRVVARLPRLTELDISTWGSLCRTRVPLGHFANLSRLSVQCGWHAHVSFFISELATVIANSPQLRSLSVKYTGMSTGLPTLSALFAKIPTNNPLRLEHLAVDSIDATVDHVTIPHLRQLTSFYVNVRIEYHFVAPRLWASLMVHNIALSDVEIDGVITEETMLYLSSLSGLKRLVGNVNTPPNLMNMLFSAVLPKHFNSLETLMLRSFNNRWLFSRATSKSIMKCLKLRVLYIDIDGKESGMPVQLFLDTVAHLPELKVLRFYIKDPTEQVAGLMNFKPAEGLRYVEELECGYRRYVLEKDGGRPVRYREIKGELG